MRFFTRDLYEETQSNDEAILDKAEEKWENALQGYHDHLQGLEPTLPAHIREIQGLLLHDALVQSIGRQGDRLILILRKDVSPRDLVILTYELSSEPVLEPFARKPRDWTRPTDFNFDEFDVFRDGDSILYSQEIVFGNGWLLHLRFRDVRATRAAPVFPVEAGASLPNLCPPVAKSA
jgi:hypothetical protein